MFKRISKFPHSLSVIRGVLRKHLKNVIRSHATVAQNYRLREPVIVCVRKLDLFEISCVDFTLHYVSVPLLRGLSIAFVLLLLRCTARSFHINLLHTNILKRSVAVIRFRLRDLVYGVHTLDHPAESGILTIEISRVRVHYKKLA